MKVINKTKNTLYIEDLDIYYPYKEEYEEIDPDLLKKSKCLRALILNGSFDIVEYDENENVEASLVYMKSKLQAQSKNKKNNKKKKQTQTQTHKKTPLIKLNTCKTGIEVKIHGIFLDASGYGKVNRNLAIKLQKAGVNVQIDAKRSQNQLCESELKNIISLEKNKVSQNHIRIDSIIPSFAEITSGKYRILYTTIESYSITDQFIECCNTYNEVWTISEWNTKLLKKHIKVPVYTIQTGVDVNLYTEKGPSFDFSKQLKDFVFVSVFGWSYRKGYDVLLKSYFEEFTDHDDVSLLIMSRYQSGVKKFHRDKIKEDIDKIMIQYPNKDLPHISRYSHILREEDMPLLYRAAHCFILTTRGEAQCLPPLEAAACGLPVIMTNCSGQQQYLRPDNSYMIDIDQIIKIQPGQMHVHYWDNQMFPSLTSQKVIDQTGKHMRDVYTNYEEAKTRNKRMQKLIFNKFTWNHTANIALDRLKEIYKNLK